MKYKKAEFEISMQKEKTGEPYKKKVQGYTIPEVPGLGIHKEKETTSWTMWYVTHITSGHKVHSDYFDTREKARKYCKFLGEIKSNGFWTKSGEEIQNAISTDKELRKEIYQAQVLADIEK